MATTQNIEVGIVGARDLFYIESSLPRGLTIAEYQRLRPRRPSLRKRFTGLAGRSGATQPCAA
jgi:hypothetical protein